MKIRTALSLITTVAIVVGCSSDKGTESNGNQPPAVPSSASPANGATDQSLDVSLSWQCTDSDNDPLTFDVHFGTNVSPALVSSSQTQTTHNPGQLQNATTYYWKINAKDNSGHQTAGLVWSFTTMAPQSGVSIVGIYSNEVRTHFQVVGDYAYLGVGDYSAQPCDPNGGLRVVNIADPTNPTFAGSCSLLGINIAVRMAGDHAFLIQHCNYRNRLKMLDISTPSNPRIPGDSTPPYGNWPGTELKDIYVSGNYAYLAVGGYIEVVDVSDPLSLTFVASGHPTNLPYPSNQILWVSGNYVYAVAGGRFSVYSVADPSNPIHLGFWDLPVPYRGESIFISGDYAYVGLYDFGLAVVDISSPTNPSVVGQYQVPFVYGEHQDYCVYVSGDYAYLAGRYGLDILSLANPSSPALVETWVPPSPYSSAVGDAVISGDYVYVTASKKLYILQFVP